MLHPRARRTACTVALCLIGGLITTVLVAWSLALWKEVSWDKHTSRVRASRDLDPAAGESEGRVRVERFTAFGSVFYEGALLPPAGSVGSFSTSTSLSPGTLPLVDPLPEEIVPAWIRPVVAPWTRGVKEPNSTYVDARGWPLLALHCRYDIDRSTGKLIAKTRGGIELGGKIITKGSWYGGGYPPSLPLTVRWVGVVGNTAFYGGSMAMLVFGAMTTRRFIRHRRGLCIGCGYELAGTTGPTCPECGRDLATNS